MKLDYFVVGTNNMNAAEAFYDGLFKNTDVIKVGTTDRMVFWQGESFAFAIAKPYDGKASTNGNGSMYGFHLETTTKVNALYHQTLKLGATCEGKPGPRGPRFSAYIRDLDGNKLCFYT